MSVCNYAGRSDRFSATESGERRPFRWYSLSLQGQMEKGAEERRGSEGGVCTAAIQPSSKKLDPIHTMPAGHEGSPNDSLLGIWKWERENERGLDPQCHPSRSSAKENKRQRSQRGDFRLESPNTSLESQRFGIQSCGRARVALSHKAAM